MGDVYPFGNRGFGSAATAPESSVTATTEPPGAGEPVLKPAKPAQLVAGLRQMLANLRIATTRLVQLPQAGTVDKEDLAGFLSTYADLQDTIGELAKRVGEPGDPENEAVQRQLTDVGKSVQGYIEGVENKLNEIAAPGSTAAARMEPRTTVGFRLGLSPNFVNWALMGGVVLAAGAGIYYATRNEPEKAR